MKTSHSYARALFSVWVSVLGAGCAGHARSPAAGPLLDASSRSPGSQSDASTMHSAIDAGVDSGRAPGSIHDAGADATTNNASHFTVVNLPAPLTAIAQAVSSCPNVLGPNVLDMTPCTQSMTPDIPGVSVCLRGRCVTLGCGDRFYCDPPAPYFPWPKPGERDFARGMGDQPVVEDRITGLVWQGCSSGYHGAGCDQGSASTFTTFAQARDYCDTLRWGGFDDWVLPDVYALASLLDFGMPRDSVTKSDAGVLTAGDPVTPGQGLPRSAFARTAESWLFSSTGSNEPYDNLCFASTSDANLECRVPGQLFDGSALCMRRPKVFIPTPSERTVGLKASNGDVVEFDPLTRTLWAPVVSRSLTEEDAKRFCADLTWAGIETWRLPDVKELLGVLKFDGNFIFGDATLRAWGSQAVNSSFGAYGTLGSTDTWATRCVYQPQ